MICNYIELIEFVAKFIEFDFSYRIWCFEIEFDDFAHNPLEIV